MRISDWSSDVCSSDLLSGRRFELPAGEHQDGRMAAKRTGQDLGPLNTQVDAPILNAGNGGLRNAAQSGELGLAKALQLANDPHRLTWGDIDALPGGKIGRAHV